MIMVVLVIVMLIMMTVKRVAPFVDKQSLVHGSDCLNCAYFKEKVSLPLVETS